MVCESVLSLTEDQSAVLKEFHRVLKTGGKLLMSDISWVRLDDTSPFTNQARLKGATHPDKTANPFIRCGFSVRLVTNIPRLLKELAAQLLWQGSKDLKSWLGPVCASAASGAKYSYFQWIAENSGKLYVLIKLSMRRQYVILQ
jgi:hypothetical protein